MIPQRNISMLSNRLAAAGALGIREDVNQILDVRVRQAGEAARWRLDSRGVPACRSARR